MSTLNPIPFNNKTAGLLVVVFVHFFVLWGLIKQTRHVHLRDHKIVVETLILSPSQSPHSVSLALPIRVQKSIVKPKSPETKPQIPLAAQKAKPIAENKPTPEASTKQTAPPQQTTPSTAAHNTTSPTIDTHYPCAAPSYPAGARRNGEQGTVLLSFLISETGQVENSKVLQSSGSSALDNAALNALSQCHFKPATENGHAVAIRVTIPYVWRLN